MKSQRRVRVTGGVVTLTVLSAICFLSAIDLQARLHLQPHYGALKAFLLLRISFPSRRTALELHTRMCFGLLKGLLEVKVQYVLYFFNAF
ncbi:hypothetical protein jhhlp_004836 [Lomentospora prolificans]|uniref:Uncharacterized protein n=1 Tax=Lomentospora prolificans TaxID=41688 RepID=A0A2N3N7S9_9PEZI|nr:hypothetical protein jhhlp_004836 [Lomentospora prolificans]